MSENEVYPGPFPRKSKVWKPSGWMKGEQKPARDGQYLRKFDEGKAMSWYCEGEWTYDGFFRSDIQDAPWRGKVRKEKAK